MQQWPHSNEYVEAIQNPQTCFLDPQLKSATPEMNAIFGMPSPALYSGNFAAVFKLNTPTHAWAVKCFTREVAHLQKRYLAISEHLDRVKLPFGMEFEYLPQGIRVHDRWFPIVKMRWIEGFLLNQFVEEKLGNRDLLRKLATIWLKATSVLRKTKVAHGDLQHGNILLVPKENGVELKLIDYDGMFVPSLTGLSASDGGHRNYQHPQPGENPFHLDVDRFSNLVIYTGLRCAAELPKELWQRYANDDNLLFRKEDFVDPGSSKILRELWTNADETLQPLVGQLLVASQGPANAVPLLDELVTADRVRHLSRQQRQQVEAILGPAKSETFNVEPETISVQPEAISVQLETPPSWLEEAMVSPVPTQENQPVVVPKSSQLKQLEFDQDDDLEPAEEGSRVFLFGGLVTLLLLAVGGAGWFAFFSKEATQTPPEVLPVVELKTEATLVYLGQSSEVRIARPESLRGHGKLMLAFSDLPAGLSVTPNTVHFLPNQDEAIFHIIGQSSATPGTYQLQGKLADLEKELGQTRFEVEVALPHVRLTLEQKTNTLRPGESIDIPVTVHKGDYVGSVVLKSLDSPKENVKMTLGERDGKSFVTLQATEQAGPIEGRLRLEAFFADTSISEPVELAYKVAPRIEVALANPEAFDGVLLPDQPVRVPLEIDAHGYQGAWNLDVRTLTGQANVRVRFLPGDFPMLELVATKTSGLGQSKLSLIPRVGASIVGDALNLDVEVSIRAQIASSKRRIFLVPNQRTDIPLTINAPPQADELAIATSLDPDRADLKVEVLLAPVNRVRFDVDGNAEPGEGVLKLIPHVGAKPVGDAVRIEYQVLPDHVGSKSGGVTCIAYRPDGLEIATGGLDKTVRLWDATTGKLKRTLRKHKGWVSSLTYSLSGKYLASASYDSTVVLWNVQTGRAISSLRKHKGPVTCIAFSRDSKTLAAGGADRTIHFWDMETGNHKGTCFGFGGRNTSGHRLAILSLDFDRTGENLVSASVDRTLIIWDVQTSKPRLRSLTGHSSSVRSVAYSPDGRTIASTSESGEVFLWDAGTGRRKEVLSKHTGQATCVAFSPDGKYLATGGTLGTANPFRGMTLSDKGAVKVHNLDAGTAKTFSDEGGAVTSVAFHPQGGVVVSGNKTSQDEALHPADNSGLPGAPQRPTRPTRLPGGRIPGLLPGVGRVPGAPALPGANPPGHNTHIRFWPVGNN